MSKRTFPEAKKSWAWIWAGLSCAFGWSALANAQPSVPPPLFPEDDSVRGAVERLCAEIRKTTLGLNWRLEACGSRFTWRSGGNSVEGRPLIYAEFGDPQATNTTLVLSGIHGDELTPHFVGFQLAQWMADHPAELSGKRVIIAPLVNPDGFLSLPRTRVNHRGVDVNRNFATQDWNASALSAWKKKFRSDPRRYPGAKPASEPETVFQEELIRRVNPQKILSIHAPLNFLDYDGPNALSLEKFPREYVKECLKLRARVKAISSGFFPGSLGNFAGRELGIPTLTLELPSADPRKAEGYWKKFLEGIRVMIDFNMPSYSILRNSGAVKEG